MDPTEIGELVRSVILTYGLPFMVLAVTGSPARWNILVRAGTGGVVRFFVAGERPLPLRFAIRKKLEAEL